MAYVTGINSIDSLLSGYAWVATPHTPVSLTYSFMTQLPAYAPASDTVGFAPMTTAQQNAVQTALAAWSAVANVTFIQVSDITGGGDIRFGTNHQGSLSAGYAYFPGSGSGGDIYLNNQDPANNNPARGSFGYQTIVHEIGHALGLKHPGDYDAGQTHQPGPFLPAATDDRGHSIMSYNEASCGLEPQGPMMYDDAAVQYLYGANTSSPGGHIYAFNDVTPVLSCIWDSGPGNAIDASACRGAVTINLNPGTFSSIGSAGNVSIAENAVVQIAKGGAGDDTFVVNGTDDTIDGGGGHNTVVFTGNRGEYAISSVNGVVTVADTANAHAADAIANCVTLQFADTSLDLGASAATFAASSQLEAQMARLYTVALGRQPDVPGLSWWVATYESMLGGQPGGSLDVLANRIAPAFLESPEYHAKYGQPDDVAFLTQLYQNALSRQPDAAGLQYWLNDMEGPLHASRQVILVGFAQSAECQAKTAAGLTLLT